MDTKIKTVWTPGGFINFSTLPNGKIKLIVMEATIKDGSLGTMEFVTEKIFDKKEFFDAVDALR